MLIGICGEKGSGKSTTAKLIFGEILKVLDVIEKYEITSDGKLLVNTVTNVGGKEEVGMGVFDPYQSSEKFNIMCSQLIWPHVKIYSFVDPLRWTISNLFNIPIADMVGDFADKDKKTHITFNDLVDCLPSSLKLPKSKDDKKATIREVMTMLGDIVRNLDDKCMINFLNNRYNVEKIPHVIVDDVRRQEEVDAIKELGGMVILLTKTNKSKNKHRTETSISQINRDTIDLIVDNEKMKIEQKNNVVLEQIRAWGIQK